MRICARPEVCAVRGWVCRLLSTSDALYTGPADLTRLLTALWIRPGQAQDKMHECGTFLQWGVVQPHNSFRAVGSRTLNYWGPGLGELLARVAPVFLHNSSFSLLAPVLRLMLRTDFFLSLLSCVLIALAPFPSRIPRRHACCSGAGPGSAT